MPTFNQLVRKGREKATYKSASPAMQKGLNTLKNRETDLSASLLRSAQVGLLVCEGVESVLKHRCLGLVHLLRAAVLDELIKGWHTAPPFL